MRFQDEIHGNLITKRFYYNSNIDYFKNFKFDKFESDLIRLQFKDTLNNAQHTTQYKTVGVQGMVAMVWFSHQRFRWISDRIWQNPTVSYCQTLLGWNVQLGIGNKHSMQKAIKYLIIFQQKPLMASLDND